MSTDGNDWHAKETYKSLMQYGSMALKFALVVNGGAAISLLTFAGNAIKNNSHTFDIRVPIISFVVGVLLGGLATVTAYFTQLTLFNEGQGRYMNKTHKFWLTTTVAIIVLSILSFGFGSVWAAWQFK